MLVAIVNTLSCRILVFLLLFALIPTIYSDGRDEEMCRDRNEEYLYCGEPCEATCHNYMYDIPCNKPCVKGCFCKPGYVRNIKYRCILPENCFMDEPDTPDCVGPNEVYHKCGTACPDTCDNYLIQKRCPRQCVEGCFCEPGYVKDDIGFCVLPKNCPPPVPPNPICKKQNETYSTCGTACPDTCETYFQPPVKCKSKCVAGCFCNRGFVRDYNNNCIDPDDCPSSPPPKPNELPRCESPYEEYLGCGLGCERTCKNHNTTIVCDLECVEGCFCKAGLVRSRRGACVHPETCRISERRCRYLEEPATQERPCSGTCDEQNKCVPGPLDSCVCVPGTVRDDMGQCVFPDFCPGACYDAHEVFDCGSPCDRECKFLGEPCPLQSLECTAQCYCKDGYARDHRGRCVQIKYCPRRTRALDMFYQRKKYEVL